MDLLSAGYPSVQVLAELLPGALAQPFEEHLVALVRLQAQGGARDQTLRAVARAALDLDQLLAEPEARAPLVAESLACKRAELSRKLGSSTEGADDVQAGLARRAAQRRTTFEFGQIIYQRRVRVCTRTESAPRYGLLDHRRDQAARVRSLSNMNTVTKFIKQGYQQGPLALRIVVTTSGLQFSDDGRARLAPAFHTLEEGIRKGTAEGEQRNMHVRPTHQRCGPKTRSRGLQASGTSRTLEAEHK